MINRKGPSDGSDPTLNVGLPESFSQSVLWKLQTKYFRQKGIDAWRLREVPAYVTNNPTIANIYAQMVWAFRLDRVQLIRSLSTPIIIIELGAGSGAFAFHFIRKMIELCAVEGLEARMTFRYILTDIVDSTLAFWKNHSCFKGWQKEGILDIAYFDALKDTQLNLQISGEKIGKAAFNEPIVVLSNYLFDSIPQDMFQIKNGALNHCLVSLLLPVGTSELEMLQKFSPMYTYKHIENLHYREPLMEQLLQQYRTQLNDTHLLFPKQIWQTIQNLQALSSQGMLLLAADKGTTHLHQLENHPPPEIQKHGSISIPVNIHALTHLVRAVGGLSFLPSKENRDFNMFAFLLTTDTKKYSKLQKAYHICIDQNNPYDFYLKSQQLKDIANQMTFEEVLDYMNQSGYDPYLFVFFLPTLTIHAVLLTPEKRQLLINLINQVWKAYYPIGEELDLAYQLACLLYSLEDYREALLYFTYSIEMYGAYTGIYYNMAVCHKLLFEKENAVKLLRQAIIVDPKNIEAVSLLKEFEINY